MFLSMLTADAAAQHGHEFSTPRSFTPIERSAESRSPLSMLSYTGRQRPPAEASPSGTSKSASADVAPIRRPTTLMDLPLQLGSATLRTLSQFSISSLGSIEARQEKDHQLFSDNSPVQRPVSPWIFNPDAQDQSELDVLSERADNVSISPSTVQRKRRPRTKTILHFAHPAPRAGVRQMVHYRPKLALQLHQASANSRPEPALDVLTGIRRPKTPKNVAQITGKSKLGAHDLVVVKTEAYGQSEDVEHWDDREVLGVIRPSGQDEDTLSNKAELYLPDGSSWKATSLQSGRYDFAYTDEHGLVQTARWVPVKRKMSSGRSSRNTSDEKKLSFSMINPSSRRHPVIAYITSNGIEIFDEYRIPSGPSSSTATTPVPDAEEAASYIESIRLEEEDQSPPIETDEDLRRLVVLTGIWVASQEQWWGAKPAQTPSAVGTLTRGSSVRERVLNENASVQPGNPRRAPGHSRVVSMPPSLDGSASPRTEAARRAGSDSVTSAGVRDGSAPDVGSRGKSKFGGLRRTLSIFKKEKGG